jgi:putative nucleotidyltransferase with HDIG domain
MQGILHKQLIKRPLPLRGSRSLIVAYQVALAGVAIALGLAVRDLNGMRSSWIVVGLLAIAAAIGERARVRIAASIEASVSLLPTVFAAALFGPLAGMIVGLASYAGDFPALMTSAKRQDAAERGSPYLKWGIYTSIRAIYGGVAGVAAYLGAATVGGIPAKIAIATTVAASVAEVLDQFFAALTFYLRGGKAGSALKASVPTMVASIPMYAPIVAGLGIAYIEWSPWVLPLFLAPTLAAQRLFALYQEQRRLADDLSAVNVRLEDANLSFATALVATLDARDRYTAGHSAAVAIYAEDIARRMGLCEDDQRLAHLCGLVHDIGKIGLPAGLLEKPGALNLDERREMQSHSEIGERILANVATYTEIAAIVRHHHERMDGGGYPDGLSADEIPLLSRVIAVADAYNAMTSDRPYRDAMRSQVARLRLAQAVESQFDISVVAVFEAILASADESYRTAQGERFERVGGPLGAVSDEAIRPVFAAVS